MYQVGFPDDEEPLPEEKNPVVETSNQIVDALSFADKHPATFVRWPLRDLDQLTGPMAPGSIWIICAASGGGKTTFVASVINLWWRGGKKVYVMPLETTPHEFRTYLACMETGIHPGDALSGQLRTLPEGEAKREILKSALRAQIQSPMVDRVMVSRQRAINLSGLERGMREAKERGADVVIIDHIDHIQGGNGQNLYAEAKAVSDGALQLAQNNGMLVLFTSQLNMSHSKGDYLTKYNPPKDEHVLFGSLKRQNAAGMIGLFRPVRKMRHNETPDEYSAALSAARKGAVAPIEALEPNTMGVVVMKSRHYGAREGARAYLTVAHGKVTDMAEADRWTTAGGYPRQVL